jgi:octaprenyl-diphosphate synthase
MVISEAIATPPAGALDRLLSATHADMQKVNALILQRAQSHVEMVPALARYLIDAGGKRLRPMLCVASALLCGRSNGSHINFAASIEFLHNATLLHDDVVDESALRRGQPAARVIWGNQASVLVGDFLLGQAFMMMVETGDLASLAVVAKASATIAEGEVFQLERTGDLDTTAEDYDEVIRAKTATLFEAACEVGAIAGGADSRVRAALKQYGHEVGCAFQLVDDVLDYRGEPGAMGKNTGDDLREGKMTLPVILALDSASSAERDTIIGALGKAEASVDALRAVVAILETHKTLDRTLDLAESHARSAREALRILPPSELKTLLGDIAAFTVSRAY